MLKNKKGVSIMVGYVILIVIIVAIAPLIYMWLKSFATESSVPECPDGVSIVIKEYECLSDDSTGDWNISLTLQNRGLFTIDEFSIKATTSPTQELATKNLAKASAEGINPETGAVDTFLDVNSEKTYEFNLNEPSLGSLSGVYKIEITPGKVVEVEDGARTRWASCVDARISEEINCPKP